MYHLKWPLLGQEQKNESYGEIRQVRLWDCVTYVILKERVNSWCYSSIVYKVARAADFKHGLINRVDFYLRLFVIFLIHNRVIYSTLRAESVLFKCVLLTHFLVQCSLLTIQTLRLPHHFLQKKNKGLWALVQYVRTILDCITSSSSS